MVKHASSNKSKSHIIVIESCNQKAFVCFDEGVVAHDRICPINGNIITGLQMISASRTSNSVKVFGITFRKAWELLACYAELNGLKKEMGDMLLAQDDTPAYSFRSKELSSAEAMNLMRLHTGVHSE